ncbi:RidA family protein [Pelagibacterium luteolum]|uniref:Enamine deaminase RidA, house cleaning of reactive enamine intermediates, YjgF/YER057c/UK114 family n=1 Tax=Pelagibacterium luteolum TaxID=440168 RepID=A0A1G7VP80_9HYPH|nr:RidA family protein [Pelagibacterium luteolum]SDG61625.1 Enamine deaminase RidA, house cleaning of reactive enamine intermediates, YjgF/YER057c/UK114 family [Pelagibacterium luteolum]
MTVSEAQQRADNTPYDRLAALGLQLPPAAPPIANFVNYVIEGNLLYISGQGPTYLDGRKHTGKVGDDVSTDEAYEHAKLTGLNLIAVMEEALGDLSRVRRIVKILGMVNATPDFAEHPQVINGCSDLFNAVFAEKGIHARSAVGFSSLPNAITVEIEAIVAIDN